MDCQCEPDAPNEDGSAPYMYVRTCGGCGFCWESSHCPHDGVQNPCPACGWLREGARTPLEFLGFESQRRRN